jgi:hypothetical protein
MESGCVSSRSDAVADAFGAEIKRRGIQGKVALKRVGCLCSCAQGPMVSLNGGMTLYKEQPGRQREQMIAGRKTDAAPTSEQMRQREQKNVTGRADDQSDRKIAQRRQPAVHRRSV